LVHHCVCRFGEREHDAEGKVGVKACGHGSVEIERKIDSFFGEMREQRACVIARQEEAFMRLCFGCSYVVSIGSNKVNDRPVLLIRIGRSFCSRIERARVRGWRWYVNSPTVFPPDQ
jgi:hypothetical protein